MLKSGYSVRRHAHRAAPAFVVALIVALTAVMPGAVFAEDSAAANDGGIRLSEEASGINPQVIEEAKGNGGNALGLYGITTYNAPPAPDINPPKTVLLKNGKPAGNGGEVKSAASGDGKVGSYIYWSPTSYLPATEAIDDKILFQQNGNKAGYDATFTVAGYNQATFFAFVPSRSKDHSLDPALKASGIIPGTYALIPAGIASRYGDTFGSEQLWFEGKWDDEWDATDPPFQYTHSYNKAANFTDRVIYQKWTVNETSPGALDSIWYWELDTTTKWYRDFNFSLQGYVYYDGDGGRNITKWVDNGGVYPAYKTKRKGFKFGGWYTKFPTGGAKITPGKTKVWFGEGYYKYAYVHWNKKVNITFNPNKGKITKGKKVVKVNYRGKLGKSPTASRAGYTSLGWYYGQRAGGKTNYTLHKKDLIVLVSKATFKTQWIKNGKGKTVSASEWSRILKAYETGLAQNYKTVKAAIGGSGMYNGTVNYYVGSDGYYRYYIRCKEYEWNGNKDETTVKMYFSVQTGNLIDGVRNGRLN